MDILVDLGNKILFADEIPDLKPISFYRTVIFILKPGKEKGCMEASRTVLDVIQDAKRNGLPLLVISTEFSKAFDTITHDHIEESLRLYSFPERFSTVFIRLARHSTMQFGAFRRGSKIHSQPHKCPHSSLQTMIFYWTGAESIR